MKAPLLVLVFLLIPSTGFSSDEPESRLEWSTVPAPTHGERPASLLIRNVMVIRGNGTPPLGPTDVLLRGKTIERVGTYRESAAPATVPLVARN